MTKIDQAVAAIRKAQKILKKVARDHDTSLVTDANLGTANMLLNSAVDSIDDMSLKDVDDILATYP